MLHQKALELLEDGAPLEVIEDLFNDYGMHLYANYIRELKIRSEQENYSIDFKPRFRDLGKYKTTIKTWDVENTPAFDEWNNYLDDIRGK